MVIHERNDLTKLNRVLECGRVVIRVIGGQWRTIGTIFILVALFSRKVFRGSDTDVETIPLYTVHFIARYTRSTSNGTLPT